MDINTNFVVLSLGRVVLFDLYIYLYNSYLPGDNTNGRIVKYHWSGMVEVKSLEQLCFAKSVLNLFLTKPLNKMKKQLKKAQAPYLDVPCTAMGNQLANAGKFYQLGDAVSSVQAYFDEPDTPTPDDPKHLYGHTFGINKLRELLYNIDDYNSKVVGPGKLLKGVRIYYSLDKRDDINFPLPTDTLFRDLVFMPVFEDGVDLYPIIGGLVNPNLILSGSRPCPPQCPQLCFINNI